MWEVREVKCIYNSYICYYSFIHRSLEWNTVCYLVKIVCNTVHWKGWKFRTISCSCFVTSKRKMLGGVPLRTSKTTTTKTLKYFQYNRAQLVWQKPIFLSKRTRFSAKGTLSTDIRVLIWIWRGQYNPDLYYNYNLIIYGQIFNIWVKTDSLLNQTHNLTGLILLTS